MSSTAAPKTRKAADVTTRVLREGYGPGAWHGADLKAALSDVSPAQAFWRPGPGRHNVAEIAVHHARTVRAVIEKVAPGSAPELPVADEDWVTLDSARALPWKSITSVVEAMQDRLAEIIGEAATEAEQLDLALGVTCHAVYHAGQIQLIKVLAASAE